MTRESSPRSASRWRVYVGLGMIAIALGIVGWFVVGLVLRNDEEKARRARAETERTLRDVDETVKKLDAAASRASADARVVTQTTFHQTRQQVFDGQCRGKGSPPFGFIVEGGTYAQNQLVAGRSACVAFGAGDNITNIFCCPTQDLAAVVNPGHDP